MNRIVFLKAFFIALAGLLVAIEYTANGAERLYNTITRIENKFFSSQKPLEPHEFIENKKPNSPFGNTNNFIGHTKNEVDLRKTPGEASEVIYKLKPGTLLYSELSCIDQLWCKVFVPNIPAHGYVYTNTLSKER